MKEIVLDTETTGLAVKDGHRIVEIGCIELDDLIPTSSENQEYGYIMEKYGDGRFSVICYDKVQRLGTVRGAIKQKSRMNKGNLVLLSLRPYEDAKCDILYQYTEDDINKLIRSKSLELSFIKSGTLSTEYDANETIESSASPHTTKLQIVSESILDTKSNDSVKAWGSDDSEDTPKSVQHKYPAHIVNDIRYDFTKTDDFIPHHCIVKGDNTYKSIASASVLAKTYRDQYIIQLVKENPVLEKYDIQNNKGYGTKKHMDAIKEYGITQWHRKSFGPCK